MSKQAPKRGLGRGLGSLIPTAPAGGGTESSEGAPVQSDVRHSDLSAGATSGASVDPGSAEPTEGRQIEKSDLAPVDGAYFAELPVTQIQPNHVQPRQVFDEDAMAELVHSINEIGLLQPIVVRKVATDSYELVMGERRWRATQLAGLEVIPAIVRETDDTDMLRDALLENLHRSQLNPLEEAAAYQQLLNDFECTHDELAQRIGRSRPQISNTIRLLKLSPSVQRRVAAGVLSAGHARALLAVDGEPQQDKLAQKVVAEGISVRGLEEIVALGDPDGDAFATPRVKRAKPSAPGLKEISDRLSDRFDTRVKVDLGRSKGKITVEFATLEDLRRIVELMSPAADESI
ncbi:ParB/RepB/Spo0J family partition protein [Nocardioides sp. NPDC006273]|uniref:ParB/RepB/Spo0J family partition protein n=1 Tax=Nocardioides sp. NPDC006273 TaxID=3155598 RepID=UPI0033AA6CDB